MKKIPLTLLLIAGICPGVHLFAQEENATEVDRILSEIESEPVAEVETEAVVVVEGVMEVTEEVDATGEMVAVVEEEVMVSENDPTAVPAINLEDAVMVDMQIKGSEDAKSEFVSLSYTDVNLADVVKMLAQTADANIIIPDGMDELVSANLNDVHWREALNVILSDKGYILVERSSGIYTITTQDKMAAEPLSSEYIDLQFITAEAALPAVQSLLLSSNARVTAIPQTNVLVLSETAGRIQEIKGMLQRVDRPRRQVFIEAKFVELNDSAIQDLGINWQVLQGYTVRATGLSSEYERVDSRSTQDAQVYSNGSSSGRLISTDNVDDTNSTDVSSSGTSTTDALIQGRNFDNYDTATGVLSTIPTTEQMVTKKAVLSADDFALTLSALQQLDGTRIVSNPKMLVANGQTATIHVGTNEPNVQANYVQNDSGSGNYVYSLDGFIEIGVKLEVTPVISTDKNITISIIPELSRLIGEKVVGGDVNLSYPITQIRRINTEFAVESGKTVAIGGLTQTQDQEEVNKIPLLGDLPIIGKYLFTHTSTTQVQDEIIIFVTVESMESGNLNEEDGIPEHGSLIYTWLKHQEAARTKKAEDKLVKAGIMDAPVEEEME